MQTVYACFSKHKCMLDIEALVYIQVRVFIAHVGLDDGSITNRLRDDGGLVGQQAVLLQQSLQVYSEEVFPELVCEPHEVPDQVPSFVNEQSGQSTASEQCAGADGRAAYAAELDQRVFLRQTHEAAAHGLAARDLRLVDVDHDQSTFVLLVQSLQEVLSAAELIDLREAFATAELAPHLFNALHAVVLEEVFIILLFLEHVVLLHGHLLGRHRDKEYPLQCQNVPLNRAILLLPLWTLQFYHILLLAVRLLGRV